MNLSFFEIGLFAIIALIVLGPDKLPQVARTLGKWYATFLHTKNRLQNDVMTELNLLETQKQIQDELAKIKQTEADIKTQMSKLEYSIQQNRQDLLTLDNKLPSTSNATSPMFGQFFVLGEYDRKKRLPAAPFLPNYQADILLNHPQNSDNKTHNPMLNFAPPAQKGEL